MGTLVDPETQERSLYSAREDDPMELIGERIVVRSATTEDVDDIVDNVRASIDELAPWMPWATPDYSALDAAAWVSGDLGDVPPMVVALDGAVIGTCSINSVDERNRSANLGYWLRSDCTGHGYAVEATILVARYGLTDGGFQRLRIGISTQNHPSRRVAERAGATFEGTLRCSQLLVDGFHDSLLYSFVAGDLDLPSLC